MYNVHVHECTCTCTGYMYMFCTCTVRVKKTTHKRSVQRDPVLRKREKNGFKMGEPFPFNCPFPFSNPIQTGVARFTRLHVARV